MLEGVGYTIWFGVFLSIWAALADAGTAPALRAERIPLGTMMVLYLATSIVSGIILGLCRPFVRNPSSLAIAGIAIVFPLSLLLVFVFRRENVSHMTWINVAIAAGISAVVGPIGATYMRLRGFFSEE